MLRWGFARSTSSCALWRTNSLAIRSARNEHRPVNEKTKSDEKTNDNHSALAQRICFLLLVDGILVLWMKIWCKLVVWVLGIRRKPGAIWSGGFWFWDHFADRFLPLLVVMENEDVGRVKRQYLQQIPIRSFSFPTSLASIQSCLWDNVSPFSRPSNGRSSTPGRTNSPLANDISTSSSEL